jgi:hypothetical protein
VKASALTAPDQSLAAAIARADNQLPLVVLDAGTVVGVVTDRTVRAAAQRELLVHAPAA